LVNRYEQRVRRNKIKQIIRADKRRRYITVDEWYRTVVNEWPTSWSESPCKTTVRSVLFEMNSEDEMPCKLIERGWFHQYRFKVWKDGEQ